MRQKTGVGTLTPPGALTVLSPVLAAVALVFLGGSAAIQAFRSASSYLPGLNESDPALLHSAPSAPGPSPDRVSRRVVVVVIDGLRLRDSFGHHFLDSLRRRGVDASARAHYPSISRPNWVSVLTGVPPRWSGVRNNWFSFEVRVDSIMDRANDAGLRSAFVADYARSCGLMFPTDFEDIHIADWTGGLVRATQLTLSRSYPLVVLLPGGVDEAGHQFGADSDEYRNAIAAADDFLAQTLADFDFERDTVIVTADHGHTDRGGHGGTEPEVIEVPLILAGAGVRPGAAIRPATPSDIAPTVATLLGLPAPRTSLGRTLVGALSLPADTRLQVVEADRARIDDISARMAEPRRAAASTAAHARRRRAATTCAAIAVVVLLCWLASRLKSAKLDWRVIVFSVPPFPLAYYALVDVFLQHFSLSAVTLQEDTTLRLLKLGLISTALQVIAAWIALRGRVVLRDRLAAANGVVMVGLIVAVTPAAVMWSAFGAGPFPDPPSSAVSVLVPATYVATASYAIGAAVTLSVEIIVFFARAIDPRIRLQRIVESRRERMADAPHAPPRRADSHL